MNTARLVIAGVVALIAASVIIGAILLLGGLFPKKQTTEEEPLSNLPVVSISVSPVPSVGFESNVTPTASPTPTTAPGAMIISGSNNTGTDTESGNIATHNAEGVEFRYPSNWGLLTCSNSSHFELDPTNDQDVIGVMCDYAVKPVTVLIKDPSVVQCEGVSMSIGPHQVTKSTKTYSDGDIDYRWCFRYQSKLFDITHRVSKSGARATSRNDYSSEVEKVIADYQVTGS